MPRSQREPVGSAKLEAADHMASTVQNSPQLSASISAYDSPFSTDHSNSNQDTLTPATTSRFLGPLFQASSPGAWLEPMGSGAYSPTVTMDSAILGPYSNFDRSSLKPGHDYNLIDDYAPYATTSDTANCSLATSFIQPDNGEDVLEDLLPISGKLEDPVRCAGSFLETDGIASEPVLHAFYGLDYGSQPAVRPASQVNDSTLRAYPPNPSRTEHGLPSVVMNGTRTQEFTDVLSYAFPTASLQPSYGLVHVDGSSHSGLSIINERISSIHAATSGSTIGTDISIGHGRAHGAVVPQFLHRGQPSMLASPGTLTGSSPTAGSSFDTPKTPRSNRRCSVCSANFKYPKDLRRHRNSKHDQTKTFECPRFGCKSRGKCFTRKDNYLRHMRVVHHDTEDQTSS
ncbi:hypothetical protein K431DRAFT_344858 [Polychaeton citri CBS 116435]|uniref:C2H2-type domain-containing protein n=1 Tax=Polychaeton citri CBS 116435 TaxID=1314669 RepID=A0A9P4US54_9PEZI|nr:hypothetical protein K431DRAFT_344858 [Polychaeton citri CBS 116435]